MHVLFEEKRSSVFSHVVTSVKRSIGFMHLDSGFAIHLLLDWSGTGCFLFGCLVLFWGLWFGLLWFPLSLTFPFDPVVHNDKTSTAQ